MYYPLFVAVAAATTLVVTPRKTNVFLTSDDPSTRYDDLCDFVKGGMRYQDPAFWNYSQKVTGLVRRISISRYYLRKLQVGFGAGKISPTDAAYLGTQFMGQILFSIGGVLESPVCCMFGKTCHPSARMALACYCKLLLRANTCGEGDGVYKCPLI